MPRCTLNICNTNVHWSLGTLPHQPGREGTLNLRSGQQCMLAHARCMHSTRLVALCTQASSRRHRPSPLCPERSRVANAAGAGSLEARKPFASQGYVTRPQADAGVGRRQCQEAPSRGSGWRYWSGGLEMLARCLGVARGLRVRERRFVIDFEKGRVTTAAPEGRWHLRSK